MPRQSQNQSPAPSRKKALLSVANLLAMMATYAPIEKSLHLEEQIQAKRESD